MAGTLYPVRFKLAWQTYSVGDVITPNALLRDWLMGNGYVERIPAETVAAAPLSQRMKNGVNRAIGRAAHTR